MAAERFSAKFSPRSFCEFTQTAWDIFSCQIGHFQLCIIIGSSFVFVIGMHDVSLFFQLAEITATTVENGDVTLFAGSGAISSCDSSGFNFFLQIGEEVLLCYLVVTCRNSTNSSYRGKNFWKKGEIFIPKLRPLVPKGIPGKLGMRFFRMRIFCQNEWVIPSPR